MLISVVLPAPLGPSRPKNSPGSMSKRHAVERAHRAARAAVGLGDLLEATAGKETAGMGARL